jgi:hypothetical protein
MKIIINEAQYRRLIEQSAEMDEAPMDFQFFRTHDSLEELREALKNNRMISVAFVKDDGTVRHMLVRRFMGGYVASEKPKTEKQINLDQNNDVKTVVDVSVYRKILKELRGQGMDDVAARAEASKKSFRRIKLKQVLGFLVGGHFVDLRDENDIMNTYGADVYGSLTKGMVKAMEAENMQDEEPDVEQPEEPQI